MNIIGIIPARYESSRFPGKPLAKIGNKSMIQKVYEQCTKALNTVYIATDNTQIENEVNKFGGNVILTASTHQSGTDRIAEAINKIEASLNKKFDIVINIQGDEPFINPQQISEISSCFNDKDTEIATLVKKIDNKEDIFNPNKPKVIFTKNNYAIYFSRNPIPYLQNYDKDIWHEHHTYYKHIGMYAYKKEILNEITNLSQSSLEIAESLEQNRWIENGYKIKIASTNIESFGIDTPEDLDKATKLYNKNLNKH
ncbi:MAG: 3-deoxy-manno-octulosonate cytidylyltransferase [Bacteroidales bacterium]|nr:3-deoxy-manno-octulosonate cytidylyltransferase [Bacteroidales bacterium]